MMSNAPKCVFYDPLFIECRDNNRKGHGLRIESRTQVFAKAVYREGSERDGRQAHQNENPDERGRGIPQLNHGAVACVTERATKMTPTMISTIPIQRVAFTGSPSIHLPMIAVPT